MEIVAERKNNMIPFALISLWSSDMFFSLIIFFSLMNRKAQKEFEELLEEAHQQ